MAISASTLASVRTKRNIGRALKDRRADAAVRLTTVKAKYGVDAVDVIEATRDGFRTTVDDLYCAGLLELARHVHGSGRLHKVSDGLWVVYEG